MSGRRVLLVSRHFPPDFAVGGKRAWRFARHLGESGWHPTVLTAAIPTNKKLDQSLPPLPDNVQVMRSYYPSWWPEEPPRASDGTVAGATRYAGGQPSAWQRLKAATRSPVGKDLWLAPRMSRHIADVAKQVGADVLWVTSSPYTATVFGVGAARISGLPLVLDLRDPWTLNFMAAQTSWQQGTEQRIERDVLSHADAVTLTCEAASQAYRKAYPTLPDGHIVTIYNSFEPAQAATDPVLPAADTLRIVHFGSCYGPRRLQVVLRAIAAMVADGVSSQRFEVLNLGRVAAEDLELAEQLQLSHVLQHRTFVPYDEGMAILAGADLLLLLAYGEETLYIPAKLFDYLLARREILCIAAPSELTDIIERTATGSWARPDDVAAVKEALASALQRKDAGKTALDANEQAVQRFAAPHTTAQLAALLERVTAQQQAR